MSIIQLDCIAWAKLVQFQIRESSLKIWWVGHLALGPYLKTSNNICERCTRKEVLLFQPELLSFIRSIVWIEDRSQILTFLFFSEGLFCESRRKWGHRAYGGVIPFVKHCEINLIIRNRTPQTKIQGIEGRKSWNRSIIGLGKQSQSTFPLPLQRSIAKHHHNKPEVLHLCCDTQSCGHTSEQEREYRFFRFPKGFLDGANDLEFQLVPHSKLSVWTFHNCNATHTPKLEDP